MNARLAGHGRAALLPFLSAHLARVGEASARQLWEAAQAAGLPHTYGSVRCKLADHSVDGPRSDFVRVGGNGYNQRRYRLRDRA